MSTERESRHPACSQIVTKFSGLFGQYSEPYNFSTSKYTLYKCIRKTNLNLERFRVQKKGLALLFLSCSQLIFVIKFLTITLKKIIILTQGWEHRDWWMLYTTENLVWHQTWIKLNGFGELVAKLEMDEEWVFIEESQHCGGRGQVLRKHYNHQNQFHSSNKEGFEWKTARHYFMGFCWRYKKKVLKTYSWEERWWSAE